MNMKTIYKLVLFWAIVLMTFACKKTTSTEGSGNNLFTETLDSILMNEPVLLSFDNGNSSNAVTWQVSPSGGVTITKAGSYATFEFDSSGTYIVTATASNKQATYKVNVIHKTYNDDGNSFGVTASKVLGANLNETIVFSVHNASSNTISWTTSGNAGLVTISSDKLSASISFISGSTGTITVSDSVHSQSRTIWLNNAVNNTAIDTVPFMFGDKLNITPSVITDSLGKKLVFSTSTTYNYQSNTDQILSLSSNTANAYRLSFGGVVMAAVPLVNVLPATTVNSFQNIPAGTYPFTVDYANQTFTSTITVTSTGVFTFNWTANNYVSIYPLTVQ